MSEAPVLVQLTPQPTLSIRGVVPVATLGASHGERLSALRTHLGKARLAAAGPPFVRYHTFGEHETDVEVGVPLLEEAPGEGDVRAGRLPGGAALVTEHHGAHRELGRAYGRLHQALGAANLVPDGAAWEIYEWIDLSRDEDPPERARTTHGHTRLVQPVREGPQAGSAV